MNPFSEFKNAFLKFFMENQDIQESQLSEVNAVLDKFDRYPLELTETEKVLRDKYLTIMQKSCV